MKTHLLIADLKYIIILNNLEMINVREIKELFLNFNKYINKENLISMLAFNDNTHFTEILYFDGNQKQINENYYGINFHLSSDIINILEMNQSYTSYTNIEILKENFWWLISDIKTDNIYINIWKLNMPLINDIEELGIMIFFSKDNIFEELNKLIANIEIEISELLYKYKEKYKYNKCIKTFLNTIVRITEAADTYIYNHSLRVADIATIISKALGLNEEKVSFIRNCALIQDIGKLWYPDSILYKEKPLNDEEYFEIKKHTNKLDEIFSSNDYLKKYVEIAKLHHERLDGSGYYGIKEDEIPIEARILAIADVFDALSNDKSYKKALTMEKALKQIDLMAEKNLLDKKIVSIAIKVLPNIYEGKQNLIINNFGFGKEIYVKKNNKKYKGIIISSVSNIIEINIFDNISIVSGETIQIMCDLGGTIEEFKGTVVSKVGKNYNILIENKKYNNKESIKVLWDKQISIVKIKKDFEKIDDYTIMNSDIKYGKIKILSPKNINFEYSKDDLKETDEIIIFFKAYGENIKLKANILNKIKERKKLIYYAEFSKIEEKYLNKLYRVIFKRQSEIKMQI